MKVIKIYLHGRAHKDDPPDEEFIIDEEHSFGTTAIGYSFNVKNPEGLKSKQVIVHPASVTAIEIEES